MPSRTYQDAVAAIDSIIPKGPPVKGKGGPSPTQQTNQEFMVHGIQKLGLSQEALEALKVIHIAGTKGKGSTAVMSEGILKASGKRTGMFTSPHIINVTERIRIDGQPIAEAKFAKYFWEVWDVLEMKTEGDQPGGVPRTTFFRLLTLVALNAFVHESLDVVILEVGIGGRHDPTNCVPKRVAGITHIGYDHVEVLGNTLTLIAGEKAGIARKGVPCLLAPLQVEEAQLELVRSATAAGALVATCPVWAEYPGSAGAKLGLAGKHQEQNASLAAALCQTWLELERGEAVSCVAGKVAPLPDTFKAGLAAAQWPGRCQTIRAERGGLLLMLDGAHTDHSMVAALEWFAAESEKGRTRELLFHCQPNRDPTQLLKPCADPKYGITCAHFAPMLSSKGSIYASTKVDQETKDFVMSMQKAWQGLTSANSRVHDSLDSVLTEVSTRVADEEEDIDLLVTGSLYIVGDMLKLSAELRP